ncbi:MAG TPA: B12-binding domain-containing protein [Pyrinomonadaceae bacterium]|nr:B12-binding domain-containing protein [Pyrinomonadaceae bacterium]
MAGRKTLTSGEAARLLGVSEASVKRWADGGLLPSTLTAGGHRRFRPEDVAVFRRNRRGRGRAPREAEPAPKRPGAGVEAAPEELFGGGAPEVEMFDALLAGDSDAASSLLVRLHLGGLTVGSVADMALCPAMRKVGDLWHSGLLTVAQEHVATSAAQEALSVLRASLLPGEPTGLAAICCSVEEDFHELPVNLAAAVLEAAGWEPIVLGANLPFYALAEAVERFQPRLVCASAAVLVNPDRAAREYAEFRASSGRAGSAVVLGGAGFAGGLLRSRFPAELHAEEFMQLEEFAASLAGED